MVKQVIDKLSSFIARIARDVEDGVKYFHSTPYFVSIHTCDLKIIANDESFQKYFGNKVGKDSWTSIAVKPLRMVARWEELSAPACSVGPWRRWNTPAALRSRWWSIPPHLQ
ncbi:MAG: hypothetical protein R2875_12300 [Desulfobacterales bacterium]